MNTVADLETVIVAINNKWRCAFAILKPEDDVFDALQRAEAFYELHEPGAGPVQAMTWDEFEAWHRQWMLERSELVDVDEETFMEQLGVLPPVHWRHEGDFEHFMCMEPTNDSWHQQYARLGDRYKSKLVDRRDPTTWITREDFNHDAH